MALCCPQTGTSLSALYWGAQNTDSTPTVFSPVLNAGQWGGDWPLHLLALLFLMQPMATSGHLCNGVPNRTTPKPFSAEPVPVIPSPVQDCASPFADSRDARLLTSPACCHPSEQQHSHPVRQPLLSVSCHLQTRCGCAWSHHPGH